MTISMIALVTIILLPINVNVNGYTPSRRGVARPKEPARDYREIVNDPIHHYDNDREQPAQTEQMPSTFFSRKSLADSSSDPFFLQLCQAANITTPSRIQSISWPTLLQGTNAIVADQTGSGKTLAYILPLLWRLHSNREKGQPGPHILVLTPTTELANQIHSVCCNLARTIRTTSNFNFRSFLTTSAAEIHDQIRMLRDPPDLWISTPGRLATILRTRHSIPLQNVHALVLDEVDFLMVDSTFGPQLKTVGAAVQGQPQFVFVTATLPENVKESIHAEFPTIHSLLGPGLHRISPSIQQTLIDVSVSATLNRNERECFQIKLRELLKALRSKRCARTLIFCNTVETCRDVENALKREDRRGKRTRVVAYHNALSPEVRTKNLRSFSHESEEERILVCTDRAARGIDFSVDHVVLFDFPRDPAEYVRRVGRTGRAGRGGWSTVFAYGWQLPVARKVMGERLEEFTMGDGWGLEGEEEREGGAGGKLWRKRN